MPGNTMQEGLEVVISLAACPIHVRETYTLWPIDEHTRFERYRRSLRMMDRLVTRSTETHVYVTLS